MVIMLLAILTSAVLTLIFKFFGIWRVNTYHAIVVNYFTAVICGIIVGGQLPYSFPLYSPKAGLALLIGVFFITGFNLLGQTVLKMGVTIGTLMQKMSVLITVLYAILWFGEAITTIKSIGIIMAVFSIFLVVTNRNTGFQLKPPNNPSWKHLALPALTFLTSGILDSLFLTGQKYNISSGTDIGFITSLFFTAGILGALGWFLIKEFNGIPKKASVLAGIVLGVANFFSIFFLLNLLDIGWDGSIVFPIFNVGVLLMSALGGWLIFKEEMPFYRVLGILIAAISIYIMSLSI